MFAKSQNGCVMGCAALVAAYFLFLYGFTIQHGHFIADDFDHVSEAFTRGAWAMALTPIDVHLAPLHQLSSYLFFHAFGLNFNLAVTLLLLVLASAGGVLFAGLRPLVGDNVAAMTVALVLLNQAWVNVTMWWSAALHRVPFMFWCALCFYGYVKYRETPRWRYGAVFLVSLVLSFGFYSKAILILLMVLGCEWVLCARESRIKREMIPVLLPAVVIVLGAVVYYRLASSGILRPDFGLSRFDFAKIAWLSVERFFLALFFVHFGVWAKHYWFGVLALALGWVVWRHPKTWLPLLIAVVLAYFSNLLLVKGRGPWVLVEAAGRYLVDDLFLLAPFVAFLFYYASRSMRAIEGPRAVIAWSLVALYALVSAWVVAERAPARFPNSLQARVFMTNIASELEKAGSQNAPVYIEDAPFPPALYGFLGSKRDLSTVFAHVSKNTVWLRTGETAPSGATVVRVDDSGRLVRSHPVD
jgi:hypothetical protein